MKKNAEYRLVCEGNFADVNEARRALHDPFIEEFVEQTGKFGFHELEKIRVSNKISLADLEIKQLEEGVFEISCAPGVHTVLNEPKAEKLAETLRQQWIFDEISVEPVEE